MVRFGQFIATVSFLCVTACGSADNAATPGQTVDTALAASTTIANDPSLSKPPTSPTSFTSSTSSTSVLAVTTSAATSAPLDGSSPISHGSLAISQQCGSPDMVGVFALDGSGVVAELPAVGRPAWSPDGARLAVLDQRTGDVQIFELATGMSSTVAHADLATRLTESPGSQGDVVGWSPDGTRLAYSFIPPASQMSGLYETHVVNADGSGNVTVAADIAGSLKSGRAPVWWGRDGRLVRVTGPPLASADPGQFSVQEIDPSTGKVGNTVATFALPHSFVLDNAVSAPLNAAAFITVDINNDHAYTVSVIDLTTGRADAVTVASATDQVEFSPDGSSLAFVTTDEVGLGDELHLYVLNGGVDRIVTTKADGRRPTWSPTGDVIAVDGVPVKLVDVSSGEVSTLDVVPFECYDLFLAWRP